MIDNLFKIKRNILPFIRGVFYRLLYSLRGNIRIGEKTRINKGCDFVFHPGCKCELGCGSLVGKHTTLAVLRSGSLMIGKGVGIGSGNQFVCHGEIKIGDNTIFGPNVLVYDHNHLYDVKYGVNKVKYEIGEVSIGCNCWIGANVVILMNVHIGDNCVVGAGSIVTKDIPNNSIAVGNPARCINKIQ